MIQWLTVTEIMSMYQLSRSHVYVLAHRHKWQRWTCNGTRRYNADDVEQALAR